MIDVHDLVLSDEAVSAMVARYERWLTEGEWADILREIKADRVAKAKPDDPMVLSRLACLTGYACGIMDRNDEIKELLAEDDSDPAT